jgi:hypothetical protein
MTISFRLVIVATFLLGASALANAYTVGNAAPSSVFFVQGQGFTPAVSGNAGSGTPKPDSSGNAQLVSVHIAFATGQTPPSTLYIYSTLPTNGDAATGVGSIASGTDSGGGTYVFNPPVSVPFANQTFAVLPSCANIYDAPDSYSGGTDLYPVNCPPPGANPIVQGSYDIGFTAAFADPPQPAPMLGWPGVALLGCCLVGLGLAMRQRKA